MSSQLYTLKYGISINGNIHLLEGASTPTVVSVPAPVGSFYSKTSTGEFYRRDIDDWELLSSYKDLDTFNKFKVIGVTPGTESLMYQLTQIDVLKYSMMQFEIVVEDSVDRRNKYSVGLKTIIDYESSTSAYTEYGILNIGESNTISDVQFRININANTFSIYSTISSETISPMNIYFSRVVIATI